MAPIDKVLEHLDGVRKRGNGFEARCPAHDDKKASLSVNVGKDGETVVMKCHAGCDNRDVAKAAGFELRDLFPNDVKRGPKLEPVRSPKRRITAIYDYVRDGQLIFQVMRYDDKSFSQRRPDDNGGWIWNLQGIERSLYRQDEIANSIGTVHVPEGEKDADRLRSLGLIATTAAGGANAAWLLSYTNALAGKHVVLWADRDGPGRKRVQMIASHLHGHVASLKVAEPPGLPEHGDVSDWIDAGHSIEDIIDFVNGLPDWEPPDDSVHDDDSEDEPLRVFPNTDTGNAERLVASHGQDIRFNWGRGVWHVWTGTHWGEDVSGRMDQLAKETVRAIPKEAESLSGEAYTKLLKWAASSESAGKRSAMVELARSEDGVPVLPEEFDSNPWLLNVANGTIDLRTGTLLAHDRADLITRCLTTAYLDDATCPTFMAFLDRIFVGNTELIAYVQRMIGYALTGSTREQAIFIAHGNGSNGKSTLLGTIASLLEGYAAEADTDSFLEKQGDRIREDVAALDGARFVAASETADGKRLSEAFIKKATGGEKLRARRLFENGYVFMPRFKIWLSTNHRPQIVGTDHAIWRRIRLLPFTVTIPDKERDRDLPEKLEAELPGILAWAVEGCCQWLLDGEQPPPAVLQATEQYRRDMDALANWLEDRCEIRPGVSASAKALYADYTAYCDGAGEEPLKQRTFGTRLTERGCGEKRTGRSRLRTGIRLRDPNEPAQTTFDEDASPESDASDVSDAFSRTFPSNNTFAKDTETNVTYVTCVTNEESVGSCVQCGDVTTGSSLCWSCR